MSFQRGWDKFRSFNHADRCPEMTLDAFVVTSLGCCILVARTMEQKKHLSVSVLFCSRISVTIEKRRISHRIGYFLQGSELFGLFALFSSN